MEKIITCFMLLIMCISILLATPALIPVGFSSPAPIISIEPRHVKKLNVGETFTVNVTLRGVSEAQKIFAVQVDIRYNPDVLNATKIIEGPFLNSYGQKLTLVLFNESRVYYEVEHPYAQVYFVASLTGDDPGAYGSGVLFTITFEVIGDGSSVLHFYPYPGGGVGDGTYFLDRDLNEIVPILEDGYYGSPIILSVEPKKISTGQSVTIAGQVFGVEGAINVTLHWRKEEAGWSELTQVQTNSTGHFIYKWMPPGPGRYYLKVSAVIEDVPVESGVVSFTVEAAGIDIIIIGIAVVIVVVVVILAFILKRRKKAAQEREGLPE